MFEFLLAFESRVKGKEGKMKGMKERANEEGQKEVRKRDKK